MKLVSREGKITCLDKILHGRCFLVKDIIKDPLLGMICFEMYSEQSYKSLSLLEYSRRRDRNRFSGNCN